MMKQREIVETELARRILKQGAKVSISGAKAGLRFEIIDQAGVRQKIATSLEPVPASAIAGEEHLTGSRGLLI